MRVNERESREQQVVRAPVHAQTTRCSHSFTDTTQIFEQKKDCSQSYNVVALPRIGLEVMIFEKPTTGPTVEKMFCRLPQAILIKRRVFLKVSVLLKGLWVFTITN